jgi:hypothetical protein
MTNNVNFNMTSDGRYFQLEGRVYDSITGLNTDIDNPHPIFICEMFKNLFIHSNDNRLMERNELFKKMKSLIYPFFQNNSNTIMEYEVRFGMSPLLESNNNFYTDKILIENSWGFVKTKLFELNPDLVNEQALDWIKNKANQAWDATKNVAGKAWDATKNVAGKAWDAVKQAGTWILNKGLPWFFQKLESFLLHPVGIAIDVALTAIGVGKIATTILWGSLGVWKIYQIITGKTKLTGNWKEDIWVYLDVAICFVGLLFSGAAKTLWSGIKAAGRDVLKLGGKLLKPVFNVIGKGGSFITNALLGPMEWLIKNLGGDRIAKMISSVKSSIGRFFDGMAKTFQNVGKLETPQMAKNLIKKDITNPLKAATKKDMIKAAQKGATWGLAFHGGMKGLEHGVQKYAEYKSKEAKKETADMVNKISNDEKQMTSAIQYDLELALQKMKEN